LLSKLYLWHRKYSIHLIHHPNLFVVICFQNCIFGTGNTAVTVFIRLHAALWFAFKIVSLAPEIQPTHRHYDVHYRCDLLSKLYLWHRKYSIEWTVSMCAQLWFAFKIVSLAPEIQQIKYTLKTVCVVICFQNCIFGTGNTACSPIWRNT